MAAQQRPNGPDDAAAVLGRVQALGEERLHRARADAQRLLDEDGVTFQRTVAGERRDQRWRLDPVPQVLDGATWAQVEAGVVQRAHLLNLVLADVYGPRQLLASGLLPPEVVHGHPGFLRPLDQVRQPGFHQLSVVATDLVQDTAGRWRPLSDRTATPSGAGYALQNRAVLARALPEVVGEVPAERLAPYVRTLRRALQEAAPPGRSDPRIAVLSPGARSETAFEHAHVAAQLGYPLVEGRDLVVRDGQVSLRAVGGRPERIDVLLRRVDAWWCDPLELRGDSQLGSPGLVETARRGGVTVVNGFGTGVLENAGLLAHLPRLAEALLGQELHLAPARTLWCGDDAHRREVLASLDSMLLKPIARTARHRAVDGARLGRAELQELRARIRAHPYRWVGQERVEPRRVPSLTSSGLADRPTVLRTFSVAAEDTYVPMRGGLTRVGDGRALAITNVGGAWAKDTWVLGADPEPSTGFWLLEGPRVTADLPETSVPARVVENLLWLGRYAERAEATVRLLRAIDVRRAEGARGLPALAACVDRLLVAVTRTTGTRPGFLEPARRARGAAATELAALVLADERTGTLAHDVRRLVGAATAVREQLSEDTWPVLGALERDVLGLDDEPALLSRGGAGPAHGRAALAPVLTSLLALQGLGAESLVRDPSWRFLEVGRRTERALQLLALLRATLVDVADHATESLVLESVLGTTESLITYRRRYRGHGQAAAALELLLADAGNPRSLVWQLDRLGEVLPALPGHPGPGRLSAVEELVHGAEVAVRTADVDRLAAPAADADGSTRPELRRFLDHVTQQLRRAAATLEAEAFPALPAPRELVATRTGTAGDGLLP